jgi:hypothetical protein
VSGQVDTGSFRIKIAHVENDRSGIDIRIPIKITGPAVEIESIDLRIGYDADALQLKNVIPGAYLQSRGIKSFNYHLWPRDLNEPGYPSGLIRIIAELDSSAIDPNFIPDPRALQYMVYLEFAYPSDTGSGCNPQGLNFFWSGCGDNIIYTSGGDSIFISNNVFDTLGVNITNDTLLPTGSGAPTVCLTGLPLDYDKTVLRGIDFYDGGINIRCGDTLVLHKPFGFKIGFSALVMAGDTAYVPVMKTAGTEPIDGFEFLIAYDTSAATLLEAIPGEIFDIPGEYEWGYFNYRAQFQADIDHYDPAASGLVRVTGMANPYYTAPPRLPDSVVLFYLKFVLSRNPLWEGVFIPVQFYWTDCADNMATFYKNAEPIPLTKYHAISSGVYNHIGQAINQPADFPTFYGADDTCLSVIPAPTRFIDFTNGGIDNYHVDPIEVIGDINLNGITYEYADALLFAQYFVQGPSVFTVNEPAQTAASDINQDGIPLMIDDFQYMARMIYDHHLPTPGSNFSGTITTLPEMDDIRVIADLEKPGGAMFLTFLVPDSGVVVTIGHDVAWDSRYSFIGDTLKIIVFDLAGESIESGPREMLKLYYGGPPPKLIDAIAAGFNGEGVDLHIKEQVPFSIKIDSVKDIWPGQHAVVPVLKTGGPESMLGFDFLFAFDAAAMTIANVTAGDPFAIPGDYEWEYFTYRAGLTPCEGCPTGMLRVVGMADQNDGVHHPRETKLADNTTLFNLDFLINDDPWYKCQILPIWFIWTDCSDNAIVFKRDIDPTREVKLAISDKVFGWGGNEITGNLPFPSLIGANNSCIPNPSGEPSTERFINFYNGYIEIICADSIDYRGDLNLNGVVPEIADIILFSDYFLKGLSVFTIDPPTQIAYSDLNQDGAPLMIDDFQYLTRWTIDAREPVPGPSFYGEIFAADVNHTKKIGSNLEKPGGAILLTFYSPDSTLEPVLGADVDSMFLRYYQAHDTLKVIIFSLDGRPIDPGPQEILKINYNSAEPILVDAIAAGYNAEPIFLTIEDANPFGIQIDKIHNVIQGQYVNVPVKKTAGGEYIWGFDFLIGYDAAALTLDSVIPGAAFDIPGDYEWEYFNFRPASDFPCVGNCPSGMVQVVAFGDLYGGHKPLQMSLPDNFTLFTLRFVVSNDPAVECQKIPIRFFWTRCGDNEVAFGYDPDSLTDIKTGVSLGVYDWNGSLISDFAPIPTYLGDASCFSDPLPSTIEKYINFFNGYVETECADTIDTRGDINLNGIAFEFSDFVIFVNYFFYGLSAFTVDPNMQIPTTDIDLDNVPLEVNDLQLLIRTMSGEPDYFPIRSFPAEYGILDWPSQNQFDVMIHSDSAVGCLYFVFNVSDTLIDITPNPKISSMEFFPIIKNNLLKILIWSKDLNSIIAHDTIPLFNVNYSGQKPELSYLEGATLKGENINLSRITLDFPLNNDEPISPDLPTSFSLGQNWPNPFNLSTEIRFGLPVQSEWTIDIFNIQGQKIRTFSGFDPAGEINLFWDGTDKSGTVQPSGIYLYRLKAGSYSDSRKMILIK